jgi:hypothetical protein
VYTPYHSARGKSVTRVGEDKYPFERTLSKDKNKLRPSSYSNTVHRTLRGDEFTIWYPYINCTVPWRQQIQTSTPKIANHSHKAENLQTADKATQEFSWSFSRIACHTFLVLLCKRLQRIGKCNTHKHHNKSIQSFNSFQWRPLLHLKIPRL